MARTKNRFNAVQIPEPVTAGVPIKQGKSFRVALYARLSVELKSRPSESIANQLSILREFIRDKAEFAEYHEYVDSAVSGTSFDRPAFKQMMDDVREGKISCIIVKDMSRFGRDYIEASNYIETIFPFLGVRFISVSDHFDTEAEFNQNKALEIALKNLVNDMYAKDISKRVSVSRRLDMERGKFTGSNAPYGYKVDSGDALRKYVIDRDAAAVVRQIFELAADGVTLREIAKALQEYRLALPGDYLKTGNLYVEEGAEAKAWYPGTISNILKNQAYIGNMVQGKKHQRMRSKQRPVEKENWIRVENTHEPIIDRQLWDKVQKLLTKKHRDIDLETNKNIFAGFIKCGDCGRAMMKNFWRRADGSKSYSFYCGTYKRSGKDYCTPHTLPFQVLNDIVLGDLKQIIRNVENLQELVKSQSFTATKIRKSTDIELIKLKAELERVKKLKKSIYEDYKDELISKEEFLSYREDYQQKETLYSKQIETLEEKKKESVTEDVFETPWLRRLLELKDIEELDRDIIVEMIDQITVYENRKLKISYNFGNELEHLFSSVYCEDLEKKAI